MNLFICIILPFLGTTIGSAMVFIIKTKKYDKLKKILLGFSSGIMLASSVWSLLIPSTQIAQKTYTLSWFPASLGFTLGVLFIVITSHFFPEKTNGELTTKKMIFAVTLHNIPEGICVGVATASAIFGNVIPIESALTLSIGIAIQNLPEGAIISMPLASSGKKKFRSFIDGMLSGIVEPISAVITILLTSTATIILPYFLAFSAGAMIFVVAEDLIPESKSDSNYFGSVGVCFGFLLMMVLDIALG